MFILNEYEVFDRIFSQGNGQLLLPAFDASSKSLPNFFLKKREIFDKSQQLFTRRIVDKSFFFLL